MSIRLRPAVDGDLEELSDLAMRSKGHWGYDQQFLDACRDELTITTSRLRRELINVAEVDGDIAGFSALVVDSHASKLIDLFVDPDHMGLGTGTLLWNSACDRARRAGAQWMDIEADPNAVGWYQSRGALRTGSVPSGSIVGRSLPTLRVDLSP